MNAHAGHCDCAAYLRGVLHNLKRTGCERGPACAALPPRGPLRQLQARRARAPQDAGRSVGLDLWNYASVLECQKEPMTPRVASQ